MNVYHGFDYQHAKHARLGTGMESKAHEIDWKALTVGCALSGMLFSLIALVFHLFY